MRKDFLVEKNGRSFVLYAGLLEEAHNQGLRAIRTQVVQFPTVDNGQTCIVLAQVETEKGSFSGIGDASPDNVTRMLAPHFIRMAETRAKARALRDAVNVAVTALEELGDGPIDDDVGPPVGSTRRPGGPLVEPSATEPQLKAIHAIWRGQQHHPEELDDVCQRRFGKPLDRLSKREASQLIEELRALG